MGTKIIEATASTSLEREWVVPRSIVQAENGFLYVPVWNLSSVGVPWRRLRGHITATLIGDDSMQIVAEKEDIGYICTIDKREDIPLLTPLLRSIRPLDPQKAKKLREQRLHFTKTQLRLLIDRNGGLIRQWVIGYIRYT